MIAIYDEMFENDLELILNCNGLMHGLHIFQCIYAE